jgi:hypothetical protein
LAKNSINSIIGIVSIMEGKSSSINGIVVSIVEGKSSSTFALIPVSSVHQEVSSWSLWMLTKSL